MTTPHEPDAEAATTLRRALAARADAVEPESTDYATVERRAVAVVAAATRRHAALAVAAAVLLVVGMAGVLTAGGRGDDDRTDVATDATTATTGSEPDGTTTSTGDTVPTEAIAPPDTSETTELTEPTEPTEVTATTAVPDPDPDGLPWPAVWPLPTMSIAYADPTDAALAFVQGYLGFTEPLCAKAPVDNGSSGGGVLVEVIHDGVCNGGLTGASEPFGPSTTVQVLRGNRGWEVMGSSSAAFRASFAITPGPTRLTGSMVIEVLAEDLPAPPTIEVRRVGELTPFFTHTIEPPPTYGAPAVVPIDIQIDGPVVFIVSDGTSAETGIQQPLTQ
jgi:hypothetical protein